MAPYMRDSSSTLQSSCINFFKYSFLYTFGCWKTTILETLSVQKYFCYESQRNVNILCMLNLIYREINAT
jgi:hypothetical protein